MGRPARQRNHCSQQGTVANAAFSADSRRIVTAGGGNGSFDRTSPLWDGQSGTAIAVLTGHEGKVYDAVFSPDGTRVLTSAADDTARLWDATWASRIRGQDLRARV